MSWHVALGALRSARTRDLLTRRGVLVGGVRCFCSGRFWGCAGGVLGRFAYVRSSKLEASSGQARAREGLTVVGAYDIIGVM